ncbi:MAG: ADP-ribosyl-[dinitrogen reductase] hydrolase [Nitrospinae bacterium]|nr:ADP-ribosyl-[dinitrogen reductase] hydrolase [Nitrospinota bacterium]
MINQEVKERALASYLGFAVGDAFGATTEFMLPNEVKTQIGIHRNIVGGGWLHLKPGRVTDDTEMCLALGDALLEKKGLDMNCVGDHFLKWMASKPVDIGSTVRSGLRRYLVKKKTVAEPSEYSAGNGAAMRILPAVIAQLNDEKRLKDWIITQGRITHNNKKSDDGSYLLGVIAAQTILEGGRAPLHTLVHGMVNEKEMEYLDYRNYKGETDGYIVNTVKIVLHFFFNTGDFESCLMGIVNRGGDADTNGALAGMLAGAFYGLDSIPYRWLKKLDPMVKKQIEKQVDDLFLEFHGFS